MARNYQLHNSPITTTRALPLRVFSVLALILPLILLIISFSLSLATIYSTQWAKQDLYYANGTISRFHNLASPFYNCSQWGVATEDLDVAGPNLTCHRIHGTGMRSFNDCETTDPKDALKCQQSVLTANLLVAGVVFISLAMALAAAVLVTGYRSAAAEKVGSNLPGKVGNSSSDGAVEGQLEANEAGGGGGTRVVSVSWAQGLDAGMLFLAATGSAMLFLAQVVGINVFVNDGFGNVNFQEIAPNNAGLALPIGSWYMGKASYVFVSVAWLAGILASFVSRYT